MKEMSQYGMGTWNACFHCGNCTAVCSLTEEGILFPRKEIRALQMGLEDKLATSVEPWLCYYCGDCTETCPRDANPGELMMSVRRWLTAKYDWTGLAGLFYKSLSALIIAFVLVAIGIVAMGFVKDFNSEAVMYFGHILEFYLILTVFTIILIPNILRMFYFTVIKAKVNAPFGSYIAAIGNLITHMFTQVKTLKCDKQTVRWLEHFLLVMGYLGLLVITVFLDWFGTENQIIIYMGYITGGLVFVFTFLLMISRLSKARELNKYSQPTDWFFIIWLFLMGFTAFLVRLFIDIDLLNDHFWIYMVHLIVISQWGMLLVPFGKWTHFLYRSFAVSFANLKKAALIKKLATAA
ncbi:MAG: 4Fe-4S dicluster domain-containing protein [Bacteroidales bacterium]|nr:4Fe-4S dicluster domain-containing protein [Bacteroidales bacterium]